MKLKNLCIVLSILFPLLYLIYGFFQGHSSSGLLIDALIAFCIIPCGLMGAWMWFSDGAGRYINGFDNLSPEVRNRFAKFYGIYIIIGMFLITLSLSFFVTGQMLPGFLLIALSVFVFFYPIRYCSNKVMSKKIPLENSSYKVKASVCVLTATVLLMPLPICDYVFDDSNAVSLEFGESDFTVKAPMFNHTFSYSEVAGLTYDSDFDKGTRVFGYGGSDICSGKFKNDSFGKYELAAYTNVKPCIVFSVNGDMFAFNQKSIDLTLSAYNELCDRVNRA